MTGRKTSGSATSIQRKEVVLQVLKELGVAKDQLRVIERLWPVIEGGFEANKSIVEAAVSPKRAADMVNSAIRGVKQSSNGRGDHGRNISYASNQLHPRQDLGQVGDSLNRIRGGSQDSKKP
jgi:hypothetical protein